MAGSHTVLVRSLVNGLSVPLHIDTAPKLKGLYLSKNGNELIFDPKTLGRKPTKKPGIMVVGDDRKPRMEELA